MFSNFERIFFQFFSVNYLFYQIIYNHYETV